MGRREKTDNDVDQFKLALVRDGSHLRRNALQALDIPCIWSRSVIGAAEREGPLSTRLTRCRFGRAVAEKGQLATAPPRRLSDRSPFSKQTPAGAAGNEKDAPKVAFPRWRLP